MTRRVLLGLSIAGLCRAANPAQEAMDLIAELAASLSAGNASRFLMGFDSKMAGYGELQTNVGALIAQGDVQCFIDPQENEGDDKVRNLELQWTLRATGSREEVVKCRVEKVGGKWRITAFAPVSLFAPF
jgi:hypothetical protein